jgi:putative ABC transport system permease protein
VQAAGQDLLDTLAGSLTEGNWFTEATGPYPTVVLGSIAAERLAINATDAQPQVWLGDQWFTVIGILSEFDLAPDLDRAALITLTAAAEYLDHDNVPTRILVRVDPDQVESVVDVLALTTNPENPDEVQVARPTDALEAKEAADDALTSLFLGLGAVGLLVGGVGIANVMVISVLERRSEIGLRRALGATRRHVALQFLGESLILATIGGVGGVLLGYGATFAYATYKGWGVLVPTIALVGGIAAALTIGVVAGLYPAIRASKLSPTEALRTA